MSKVIRKITSSKQVTLPPDFCKKNGLTAGAYVVMSIEEGKLIIKPHQDKSKSLKKLEALFEKTPVEFRDTSEEDLLTIINSEIEETRKKPARHPSRKSRV
jgi:antitoxin component of MazEF toxin-antitoxin module